jgi:hypothetical protein
MGRVRDPRLQELKRLQRELDEASRYLDEFEARALRRSAPAASQKYIPTDNNLARHIADGLEKFRRGR